jgi:ABC-2 type transport system permease protein
MKNTIPFKGPYGRLILSLTAVIVIALLLSLTFHRFDLTAEKRYTLSDYSKNALRNLDTTVTVEVYLDGDLNIPFRKMQQRLEETLEEFQVYAGDRLNYEIINPFKGKNPKEVNAFIDKLVEKGLKPSNILAKDKEGGTSQKLVIPGVLIKYRKVEIPINLLKNNAGVSAEENLNNSIQSFEYEFMRIIGSLASHTVEKVAFLEGQGEYNEYQVGDITRELGWYFQVDRGTINGKPGVLDQYKAVIIAGPSKAFKEQDKFVLDQYLMHGGNVLWFVDMVHADIDSISKGGMTMALINQFNIEDMLFRYGIRINPVLVQDIQCDVIPVNLALTGNTPDFRPAPWLYSPLLSPPYKYPITRNLNMVKAEFAGSIDTIGARKGIHKTALLTTSQYSRQVAVPVVISLSEVRLTPRQEDFNSQHLPVAVLLDGKFESAFQNRMISSLFPDKVVKAETQGAPASVLVVADADIIRNDIRPTPQGVMISPLGFDRYTKQTFGNKEFIVNAIQYMTGHKGLVSLRSRELTLRLLDKQKLRNDRKMWVLINTICPPVLIIIAGIIYNLLRKKKYTAG